jgi:hypothetical protein
VGEGTWEPGLGGGGGERECGLGRGRGLAGDTRRGEVGEDPEAVGGVWHCWIAPGGELLCYCEGEMRRRERLFRLGQG